MNRNGIIITILVAIIVGGGGFFAGMQYQKSQRPNFAQFANGQGGFRQRFGGQGGQNFQPVRGQITSIDNNTLTVKDQNGNSKIVVLSGNTAYTKSENGAKSDLKTGDTILVLGSQNSDGSVTAQNVSINPQNGRMMQSTPSAQ